MHLSFTYLTQLHWNPKPNTYMIRETVSELINTASFKVEFV